METIPLDRGRRQIAPLNYPRGCQRVSVRRAKPRSGHGDGLHCRREWPIFVSALTLRNRSPMTIPHRLGLATLFVVALAALWAWGQAGSLSEDEELFAG